MPRVPRSVYAATAIVFVGLALALFGAIQLEKRQGTALALIGSGLAVVLLGSWVSARKR